MKKLFTIAALFMFMFSLTSFVPNDLGGKNSKPTGAITITSLHVGGGKDSKPTGA
ncbi:hypothetical protein [Flavobacterium sp.]|uniref:hypothetical protein n=1 Tax=Flavobacterium sp. TaxID=239 RepID=UPI0037520E3E